MVKHNFTGLHLVVEVVAEVFIVSWLPSWNPWYFLSCWSSVEEIEEREKVAYRRGMPKGGSIVQVQTNRCKKAETKETR